MAKKAGGSICLVSVDMLGSGELGHIEEGRIPHDGLRGALGA